MYSRPLTLYCIGTGVSGLHCSISSQNWNAFIFETYIRTYEVVVVVSKVLKLLTINWKKNWDRYIPSVGKDPMERKTTSRRLFSAK